jgi:uncharacterized membrane protein YhaH (DUF805 family)
MENWAALAQTPLARFLGTPAAPPPMPGVAMQGRQVVASGSREVGGWSNDPAAAFAGGLDGVFSGVNPGSQAVPGIGFVDAIKRAFSKYATFTGRASRSEYWWFALFNFIVSLVLSVLFAPLSVLYSLATLIPAIAIGVRRLHDIGRSGWWLLIGFVPLVGIVVLIVFFVMASEPRQNQYG